MSQANEQTADYQLAAPSPVLKTSDAGNIQLESLTVWLNAQTRKSAGRGRSADNTLQYGVQKLREMILELAVSGRLVPQDPNDEHASNLLEKIINEKKLLINSGEIKKEKELNEVTREESFPHPNNWALTRYGKVTYVTTGKLDANAAVENGFYPFFTCSRTPSQIDTFAFDCEAILLAGNGDFNLKMYEGKFNAYQRTYVIRPILLNMGFLYYLTVSQIDRITENHRGSAIPYLKIADITNPVVAIPPLAEQHRIVKKVDELMALCDQLEQEQADAIQAHDTLVKVLLETLTQSENAEDFQQNWHRIAEHFDTLFTTESSIDQLKQTLLQLAVMGKLVPQNPNDEPASVLLEKIADEKARLVKEGKIKKQKLSSNINDAEKPFTLPISWKWSRLSSFSFIGTGTTPLRSNQAYFEPPEVSWVTSGETSNNFVSTTKEKISPLAVKENNLTIYPSGTLIIAMYGQGKTRGQITELLIDATINQACAAIQPIEKSACHRAYIKLFFQKAYEEVRSHAAGGARPNLNLQKVSDTIIPIPPLAEQHRIVKKVDELMAVCDQLKDRLNQLQILQKQLADAAIKFNTL